jgi:hypothetical protein
LRVSARSPDGLTDLIVERYDALRRQGAVLVDDNDPAMSREFWSIYL